MINRRFNDRASCFAQRRLYCEGNAKKKGDDFLCLLLETANIRVLRSRIGDSNQAARACATGLMP
jgi:hypothetical protein